MVVYLDHAATTPMLPEAIEAYTGAAAAGRESVVHPQPRTERETDAGGGPREGRRLARAAIRSRWCSPPAAPRRSTSPSRACTGRAARGRPRRRPASWSRAGSTTPRRHGGMARAAARAPSCTGCRSTRSAASNCRRCREALRSHDDIAMITLLVGQQRGGHRAAGGGGGGARRRARHPGARRRRVRLRAPAHRLRGIRPRRAVASRPTRSAVRSASARWCCPGRVTADPAPCTAAASNGRCAPAPRMPRPPCVRRGGRRRRWPAGTPKPRA